MKAGTRLRVGIGVCLLIVTGCSPFPHSTLPSPSGARPSPSVSVPSATPTPGGIAVNLHCRLPVFQYAASPGGWVTFPGGQLTLDAAADVSIPGVTLPGRTYNSRFNRWIPVPWAWVSGDNARYAYVGADNTVHAVDIATGKDSAIAGARDMVIIGFEGDAIYTKRTSGNELWRISPSTGSVVQVLNNGSWQRVGHGNAWGSTFSQLPLIRVDLRTAGTEFWYSRGPVVNVFGVDAAGRPVVEVGPSDGRGGNIMVVLAADQGDIISPADTPPNPRIFENTWAAPSDSHGVWLAANDGIYLVIPAAVPFMVKVSDVRAVPVGACN